MESDAGTAKEAAETGKDPIDKEAAEEASAGAATELCNKKGTNTDESSIIWDAIAAGGCTTATNLDVSGTETPGKEILGNTATGNDSWDVRETIISADVADSRP